MGRLAADMAVPLDEEPLDRYLNRPAAVPVVRLLLHTPVSANQVSVMAAVAGILAGVLLGLRLSWGPAAALGLGWAAMMLDCADGQIARARGGGTRFGYLIDGACDYVIATATHVGFILAALASPAFASLSPVLTVAVVVACGIFMAVHSGVFESLKFRYRGALGGDLEGHLNRQKEILAGLESEKGLFLGVVRSAFGAYLSSQSKLNDAAIASGPISRGTFLLAVLLGPTMRLAVLLLSAFATRWWADALWAYPVYALVFANLVYVWVSIRSRPSPAGERMRK